MVVEPAWLQAASTVVLVAVTAYYTYLLHRQNKRERRTYHSDTLRDRILAWRDNLPEVKRSTVTTAEPSYSMSDENEFYVAPDRLEEDPYFQDLLRNHAPELAEQKTNIETAYSEFNSLRDRFIENFDDYEPIESASIPLEPTVDYPGWIFDMAVCLSRTSDTKTDLQERAITHIEHGVSSTADQTRYPTGRLNQTPILTRPRDNSIENDVEVVSRVVREAIGRIDTLEEYELAKEAGAHLDEMDALLEALEADLVEYDGMATYPGTCAYLK